MSLERIIAAALVAATLTPLSVSSVASNEALNVQALYQSCQAPDGSARWALCWAYIVGVGNAMQFVGAIERNHPNKDYSAIGICGEASNAAMVQAFKNWAEKNPREWNQPQVFGVINALGDTWP